MNAEILRPRGAVVPRYVDALLPSFTIYKADEWAVKAFIITL